ncbi:MAG: alpha/beta hydrolase [Neomegalonema sp.]|nr:alpha/beta hydrolase [Neomegalonema sp.]
MAKISFSGPLSMRLTSFITLNAIGMATYVRHALGRRMEPTWDVHFETGVRFWRRQFTRAMRQADIAHGRRILDSVQTETDDVYDVAVTPCEHHKGHWFHPAKRLSDATLLYFHGGGYAFYSAISKRFAAMLAHRCGAQLFAPDYRLTPEHPHPAQAEDALAAWRHAADSTPPEKLVVVGDSAGGHMALSLLLALRASGLPQPAICIGLCPWTDIGHRGASLYGNDRYDIVQGWMALRFGEWLDPTCAHGRAALSPIFQDFSGLAPIYLQAGGREVLCDMVRDFAAIQAKRGADVMLDVWPDMPHDFQIYDTLKTSSTEALLRIRLAIAHYVDQKGSFTRGPNTVLTHGVFAEH